MAESRSEPAKKTVPTGELDLGSWQKKLSNFASNPASKQPRLPVHHQQDSANPATDLEKVANLASLKVEWQQFLDHLARKTHTILATHLQSCELVSCSSSGTLEIACCRKFSYEELLQERATLQQEISEFYALPLQVAILYDAEKDACTKEKSVFTIFQELSQKNEVIRFLITEFGSELVY
ncbi:MAG: DNA polymerase III subunit gamma/tau [Chlorobium sp.]